ncbi:YcaO-like family protein [Oleidesulfovibrio sp.]|uniref:YcaO-like family protein n=1 Tax=Oleidesulfovibrio sp. TaxID=2909707 RepID=UPI003A8C6BAE
MHTPASDTKAMDYAYTLTGTEATTGYFSCEPPKGTTVADGIAWLESHPADDFMHLWLLRKLTDFEQKKLRSMITKEYKGKPVIEALLYEVCLLTPRLAGLLGRFADDAAQHLQQHTPLPYIKWSQLPDKDLNREWVELFRSNMHDHNMLPHPEDEELPPLFDLETVSDLWLGRGQVSVADVREEVKASCTESDWQRPPAQETAMLALERLVENNIIGGVEMRHIASLSPIALLRQWQLDISVQAGANNHHLKGLATTYGRGLSLADARVSYAMEMVERASSYASVIDSGNGPEVTGRKQTYPVTVARYSELVSKGIEVVNPNDFPLEVPYQDEPLHWMEGRSPRPEGETVVLVPVQMVFLFCNLDEVSLYTAPGSTGLASGNIMEEAKVAALTEIIERDAEATVPYTRGGCFTLTTDDPKIKMLLDDYKARGIHLQFQDLTTGFEVPCYKAFVIGKDGNITRATGAGLDGRRAIVSCLTETPYPYPNGPESAAVLPGIPERKMEDLPDMSLGCVHSNLALLERMFTANNRTPVYVDLSRSDLQFPVVRALVPGMELTADFTPFTRVNPRLYKAYLELFS